MQPCAFCRLKPYDPTSSGRNLVAPATSRCCRVFTNCPHLRHICVCLVVAALSKRTKTRRATQPQPPSLSVSSTHPASRVQARWCAQCSRMRSTCAAAPRARNHHLSARHTPHVRHTCVTPQNPSHMRPTVTHAASQRSYSSPTARRSARDQPGRRSLAAVFSRGVQPNSTRVSICARLCATHMPLTCQSPWTRSTNRRCRGPRFST